MEETGSEGEVCARVTRGIGQGIQSQGELLALPCLERGPSPHTQTELSGPPLTTSAQSILQGTDAAETGHESH